MATSRKLFSPKSLIVDVQLGSKYSSVNIFKKKLVYGELIKFFKVLPKEN